MPRGGSRRRRVIERISGLRGKKVIGKKVIGREMGDAQKRVPGVKVRSRGMWLAFRK